MTKLGTTIAAAVIGTPLSLGGAFATVQWADGRYAPLAAVEDLAWSALKDDIRELRERIRQAQSTELREDLERAARPLLPILSRGP